MPFKPGHQPHNKGKKSARVVDNVNERVTQETIVSAPTTSEGEPVYQQKLKAPKKPEASEKMGVIPQLPSEDEPDFNNIHGWNMAELELLDISQNRVPDPPKCVMEWCRAHDLKWRWMSYPAVKQYGMRGHVAFSVSREMYKKIKNGDCPPTIDIDVTNKLVWREDAFLGVIPVRLAEFQKAAIRQRTIDQTKLAAAGLSGGLREVAQRAGGKIVDYSVEESSRQGL